MKEVTAFFEPEWYCPNCEYINSCYNGQETATCSQCGEEVELTFNYPEEIY